jgi:hypothetical protein
VKYRRTGCFATKELEIFDLLRRWHIMDKWEGESRRPTSSMHLVHFVTPWDF